MGIFSKFEGRVEDTFEGAANKMFDSPISPVQIAKKAEKQMRREKMVGAGKQYAPTLYTILVNANDDQRLFGYYPTLAGETETYLSAKSAEEGLVMDGQPLVRFIADDNLKHGKFEVIAEMVAAPIISQLRAEEMERYGLKGKPPRQGNVPHPNATPHSSRVSAPLPPRPAPTPPAMQNPNKPPLPYVPENDLDYSIDYGEYTFDSRDFENYQENKNTVPPYDASSVNSSEPPNTVVFASGSGNAQPMPDQNRVRARLMNTTDNRNYDLATSRLLLGRDSKNDIVVDDINASRNHAELRLEPQGVWAINDLGSTNGTLVNGREITSQVLNDGDYITIGMTNYVFIQA